MNAPRLLLAVLLAVSFAGGLWFLSRQGGGAASTAGLEQALEPGVAGPLGPAAELAAGGGERVPGSARSETSTEGLPLATSPAEREPRSPRLVRGRVVDEFGGALAGVRVVYAAGQGLGTVRIDELGSMDNSWIEVAETSTDVQGRFEFEFARRGSLLLALRHPGFAPLRSERQLEVTGTTELGDLVLERGVVLAGHVVDSAGRGVAGAELHDLAGGEGRLSVSFVGSGAVPLAVTDEGGAFTIDELPVGPFRLRIEHEAHPNALAAGNIARAGERRTGERYELEDGFEIAGLVLGLQPGDERELIVRAARALNDYDDPLDGLGTTRSAALDAGGRFLLRGLREGRSYRISAVDAQRGEASLFFSRSRSTVALAEAGEREVRLELREPPALVFQVVDDASGEPLTNFEVEAGKPWMTALRGADDVKLTEHPEGRVRYQDVPLRAGETRVDLRVRAAGYRTWNQQDIVLAERGDTDLGVLRLVRVPIVTVRVTDLASGEPVAGASVTLRPARERGASGRPEVSFSFGDGDAPASFEDGGAVSRGRTDEQGLVELASLPGRRAELEVRHKLHADYLGDPISLPSVGEAAFEVALWSGGTVVVRVVDAAGQPLPGARVEHHAPDDDARVTILGGSPGERSDQQGSVTYKHLVAGAHHFALADENARGGFAMGRIVIAGLNDEASPREGGRNVLVTEGSHNEVVLRAKPRGTLVGQVTEAGEPLAGASIRFEDLDAPPASGMQLLGGGGGPSVKTDGQGEYRLADLKVGEYRAHVTHPTRAMDTSFTLSVSEGEQTCNFPLSVSILEGRVLDPQGRGVEGVKVTPRRVAAEGQQQVVMRAVMVVDGGAAMTIGTGSAGGPTTYTDREGRYSLRGVAPEVEIYVETDSANHRAAKSEGVVVGDGQTRSGLDVVVHEAGGVEVRVVDSVGDPRAFCTLRGVFEGESEEPVEDVEQFVGEGGTARLASLHPGIWRLSAQGLGMNSGGDEAEEPPESESVRVEVRAGEVTQARVELP